MWPPGTADMRVKTHQISYFLALCERSKASLVPPDAAVLRSRR